MSCPYGKPPPGDSSAPMDTEFPNEAREHMCKRHLSLKAERAYLSYLAVPYPVAASTQNVASTPLRTVWLPSMVPGAFVRCMPMLATDLNHLTWIERLERRQGRIDKRHKVLEPVPAPHQHDDTKRDATQVLLVPQLPVDSRERVESTRGGARELDVLASPQASGTVRHSWPPRCFLKSRGMHSMQITE